MYPMHTIDMTYFIRAFLIVHKLLRVLSDVHNEMKLFCQVRQQKVIIQPAGRYTTDFYLEPSYSKSIQKRNLVFVMNEIFLMNRIYRLFFCRRIYLFALIHKILETTTNLFSHFARNTPQTSYQQYQIRLTNYQELTYYIFQSINNTYLGIRLHSISY